MTKSDYSACVLLSMPLRVKSSIRVFIFAACILTGTLNVIGWGSTPIRYLYLQEGDVTISTPSLLRQPTRKQQQQQQQQHRQQGKTTTLSIPKIAVFYNLYIPNRTDVERVSRIVDEQFRFLRSYHSPIYVHSIGVPHPLHDDSNRTILLGHHDKGSEVLSLQSLWEHCKRFPQSKVVYLHSKGSYTNSKENEMLRRFITKGATSDDCATMPDSTCNVCSSRFSPLPHPHTSGNMWLANCDYIQRLIEPAEFESRMEQMGLQGGYAACEGRERYSLEHWVHSHPTVRPCDLYNDPSFTWNYHGLPTRLVDDEFVLQKAPRFDLPVYQKKMCKKDREGYLVGTIMDRLQEYEILYEEQPSQDWWGWKLWPNVASESELQ